MNEKQVESVVRSQKESVKAALGECRDRAGVLCGKAAQELLALREGV